MEGDVASGAASCPANMFVRPLSWRPLMASLAEIVAQTTLTLAAIGAEGLATGGHVGSSQVPLAATATRATWAILET